jgi:nucleoside-diphosphate kinase
MITSTTSTMLEKTLCLLKPDSVESGHIGDILCHLEHLGFKIIGLKMKKLTREKGDGFYIQFKESPQFEPLVSFLVSSPIVVVVLEGIEAVKIIREIAGAADPSEAELGTMRKLYGQSLLTNAIHCSDSASSAEREIRYFFSAEELF